MKSIKKYITNRIQEDINIESDLELHFYIEFLLEESFKYSYFTILEKHSSYIEQKELVIDLSREIYNIIRNHEPEDTLELDKKDLEEYPNIFFNKLIIYLYGKTGYNVSKSKYIDSEKTFDKVIININPDEYYDYKDIVKCLVHELLHAYNEYKNYLTNSNTKLVNLTDKNSSYFKTIFSNNITIENICKRICNNIRKWEQNAYISELSTELENNKFDFYKYSEHKDAYKKAFEIFRNSDTWIQYSTLKKYLTLLKDNSDENKLKFQNAYNNINNTSLSFNKIYKKLNDIFNIILNKINRLIPKLIYDYYEKQMKELIKESIIQRQNKSLIEFVKSINEYNLLESVKPENGEDWEVYVNNKLDNTFTKWAKKWKKYPKVGKGWYTRGVVFKVIKIEDNKVYTKDIS